MSIGKQCAEEIYQELNNIKTNKRPSLAVVQVGDDPASTVYIKCKQKACERLNYAFQLFKYPLEITTSELSAEISKINANDKITGCIVQLPLPEHVDKRKILDCVNPDKDVDCFNFENIGKLYLGTEHARYIPATVYGIYRFIKINKVKTRGKCCVIIGKSTIVGRPLQLLLSDENDCAATTILCDKYTENLEQYTRIADILIVAANKRKLINDPQQLKEGAVVIDVGIHNINGRLTGDVAYDKVHRRCSLITPVPGGVGPMTVAGLMYNLTKSAALDIANVE